MFVRRVRRVELGRRENVVDHGDGLNFAILRILIQDIGYSASRQAWLPRELPSFRVGYGLPCQWREVLAQSRDPPKTHTKTGVSCTTIPAELQHRRHERCAIPSTKPCIRVYKDRPRIFFGVFWFELQHKAKNSLLFHV